MAGLNVSLTTSPQWRALSGRFANADAGGELAKIVQAWGKSAVEDLKRATPVRTGAMQRSWRADYLPREKGVKVTQKQPYALWIIQGTGQSTGGRIYPKNSPFLYFMGQQGHLIRKRSVRGIEPNPRLNAVLDSLSEKAVVAIDEAGARIVHKLVGD